eukprot:TRINITY_DN9763_c0_g2_i1.p1 TRINITY_DN9763_c0_g2~~TRINITY_DN9763_c0_g2_i1.p1  ORF type:complete len:452 (+),score=168.06 TRINITY_DN9763_c0_g2_i1:65-1357(+)
MLPKRCAPRLRRLLGSQRPPRAGAAAGLRACSSSPPPQRRELPDGSLCIGEFEGHHLRRGQRVDPDGTRFVGDFSAGRLVSGSVVLPDGRKYTGSFTGPGGGLQSGTLEEDGAVYEGEFDGQWRRHGKGKEVAADGSRYEGTFNCDELTEGSVHVPADAASGRGAVAFRGTLAEGRFAHGELRYDGMVYNGALQNNTPHGAGRLELADGSVQEGAFLEGRLHGGGKVILRNGTVYAGEFDRGRLRSGEVRWADGVVYEGQLDEKLRPHGEGSMYKPQHGHWWRGQWAAGTFSGGSVTDADGAPVDYRIGGSSAASGEDLRADFERQQEEEWEERRFELRCGDTSRADWEAAMRVDAARWLHFRAVWLEWTEAQRRGGASRFVPPHGFDWTQPPAPAPAHLEAARARPQSLDEWKAEQFVAWRLKQVAAGK